MSPREIDLPDGWFFAPLSDLGTWSGGGTPSKTHSSFWNDGSIPWVSPKDMKVERIHGSEDHITEEAVRGSATKLIPAGSVLFVTRSGILAHTFPVAVTTIDVTVNQDLKAVTPRLGLNPDYLAWGARALSGEILRQCSKNGTTVASIDTERLMRFELPVAPLPEQQRIVQAIESYFTRLADAVGTLKRVQRNLKRYRASVLKAAVEGRLVPTEAELARADGRDYEPASVLLERILTERRRRWQEDGGRGKYQEPVVPVATNLPELPEGWCWSTVDALTISGAQNGLYVPKAKYGAGVPILRIDDYQTDWSRSSNELQRVDIPDADAEKYGLAVGNIVINRVNSPSHLGKSLAVLERNIPAVFESNMMRFALSARVIPGFIQHYLSSTQGKARLTKNAKWAVNQASINQGDVGATAVPLPPVTEQRRIVAELGTLLSTVAASEVASTVVAARCARLRQAILKWAFGGRLADQHPCDEPASVLLERIRTETAAGTGSAATEVLPKRRGRNGTMTGSKSMK